MLLDRWVIIPPAPSVWRQQEYSWCAQLWVVTGRAAIAFIPVTQQVPEAQKQLKYPLCCCCIRFLEDKRQRDSHKIYCKGSLSFADVIAWQDTFGFCNSLSEPQRSDSEAERDAQVARGDERLPSPHYWAARLWKNKAAICWDNWLLFNV